MSQPEVLLEVEMNEKQCPIEKKTFSCTLCSYSSDYRTNVKTHTTKVHKKKLSNLECCNIRFSDKASFQKHLSEFHVHRYHCSICKTGFYNTTILRRHEARCPFITAKQETLQKKELEVHQMNENEDLEPSSLPNKSLLPQKNSTLTFPLRAKFYKCTECSFKSKWPNSLYRHLKLGHKTICNCCGSNFTSKRTLQKHKLAEHTKEFKCSVCAKKFSSLLLLRSHQITHLDHQNFKCDFCDYSSLWKSNLKKHLSVKHGTHSSTSLSLASRLDQDNRSPICVDLSDECDAPSEKEIAADDPSVRLLPTPGSNGKRKSGESNHGKENLDVGETRDANKNVLSLDFTHDLVEQQLKLRRKSITKEQMNVKCSNRSASLDEGHSNEAAVSLDNSNSEMAEMLSTSTDDLLLRLDSDEETNESNSQTSPVMDKSENLQGDFKGKKTLLEKPTIYYKCTVCPHKTKWRKSFKQHIKIHERQGIDCSLMTLSLSRASIVPRSSSVKSAMAICSLCSYTTKWPGNLKSHMTRTHGVNKFKCADCPREFDSPFTLRHHQAAHSDSVVFECSMCEFTTSHPSYLTRHVNWKHKLEDQHSLASPLKKSSKENSSEESASQQQTALNTAAVSLTPKQTKIELMETNNADRSTISESDHSFSSPQSSRFPPSAVRRSGRLATEKAPLSVNDSYCQPLSHGSTLVINSIHDEARQIRAQLPLLLSISAVMPLLQRLLEMCSSIVTLIRETMEAEARSQTIETFEYVWNTSKVAVVRWEDMKGLMNDDISLNAVRYAYGTLPLFNNWEKSEHLEMLENAILLIFNTVKNSHPQPLNRSELRFLETNLSFKRIKNAKNRLSMPCLPSDQSREGNVASGAVGTTTKANVSSVDLSKDNNLASLKEFCRLANISTWQNTKCRGRSGFKDDNGDYHSMYRIGIGKMLNLYCPADVTHLKCCGKVFDLSKLKDHVNEYHGAGRPNRTEPSISPA